MSNRTDHTTPAWEPAELAAALDRAGLTPIDVLGRIVTDAPTDAHEIREDGAEMSQALVKVLGWTKPSGGIDGDQLLEAFSLLARSAGRFEDHAREREQLVDQAAGLAKLARIDQEV